MFDQAHEVRTSRGEEQMQDLMRFWDRSLFLETKYLHWALVY
jgi:hypothetical protein